MLNGNGTAPKVVVVGGSLGGLFNAIALRSLGCEVEVFEKSSGLMKDRGAGMVFQQEVAEFLTRYEVAPLDSIYRKLRDAFGDEHYHAGVRLVGFEARKDTVTARFEGGRAAVCDLLIGADGPGSA